MILLAQLAPPTTLTLDLSRPGVAVSPNLYGLMTEEINYSYDGGLYAELVRNRTFKDDANAPTHWTAEGEGASVALDRGQRINDALTVCLRVKGGAANDGYWGIPVRPSTTYRASFWAKSDASNPIGVSVVGDDGTVYAKASVAGVSGTWKKYATTLTTPADAPSTTKARLVLSTGPGTTWLNLVSLFPPTFNDRPNGNRPDLMKLLSDMKPAFLRFPGGNYLEGDTFRDRFPWKETLGPLENRPGHMAPWSYRSSDGMGLLEFLNWCEDMKAKPLLGLFAGYVLRGDVVKSGTELDGFVQDALDEIEYVAGDARTTKWGARRAKDGHPAPFKLETVEIGNEDWFDKTDSYPGRYAQFVDAIRKKYPKLKIVSSVGLDALQKGGVSQARMPEFVDDHYYNTSWEMMNLATRYDKAPRTGPKVFVGEWASQDVPTPWRDVEKKGPTPAMGAALGDAAFMTGLERNSDVVQMACYAPLLVNVNPGGRQWGINLIGYDALASFGSPSYYAQKMFGESLGDRTVPVAMANAPTQTRGSQTLPGLFVSATRDTKAGTLYLKLVNALATAQEIAVDLRGAKVASDGTMTTLSGSPTDVNSLAEPMKVSPVETRIEGLGSTFRRVLPAHSVVVLRLATRK